LLNYVGGWTDWNIWLNELGGLFILKWDINILRILGPNWVSIYSA
jgi:hypothetical protein